MKKVLLSGAALLIAAASFAQNVVTTAQNGTANSVSATQGGSSLTATISQVGTPATNANNLGFTKQSGNGHTATVTQDGASTFNRGAIQQKNLVSGTGSNSATITQTGSGGTSLRSGDRTAVAAGTEGNWAGVSQEGSANKATITATGAATKANFAETWQKGIGNTATTTQSLGTKNRAEIFQGDETRPDGPGAGTTNVEVTGNKATVDQSNGSTNDAIVRQFSNTNTAEVLQNVASSMNNVASVKQGDGTNVTGQASNTAVVTQTGLSTGNSASVVQTGTLGRAYVTQNDGYAASSMNQAFINQVEGSGSYANIYQTGATSGTATINQHGDGMQATISQFAANVSNVATINQGKSASIQSDGSLAYVYQVTVANSKGVIDQNQVVDGVNNRAIIDQRNGTLQMAHIMQEGSYNEAGLFQTGAGSNTATASQKGDYNVVGGPGVGNLYAPQYANVLFPRAAGSARQDGSGNLMDVKQESTGAPASLTLYNNAILDQTGTGNTISLSQTLTAGAAAGNMATITQNGGQNSGTVIQSNVMLP